MGTTNAHSKAILHCVVIFLYIAVHKLATFVFFGTFTDGAKLSCLVLKRKTLAGDEVTL